MKRNPSESSEHEELINMMAHYFTTEGYRDVKADIPGMPRPDLIHGTKKNHIPDLTAYKNGIRIILEAETSSTIFDNQATSQWSLFSDATQKPAANSTQWSRKDPGRCRTTSSRSPH